MQMHHGSVSYASTAWEHKCAMQLKQREKAMLMMVHDKLILIAV